MISDEEIRTRVVTALAEEFELDPAALQPQTTLFDELGLDSLDAVDMVVALEKAMGMKLGNEEAIREVRTVGDLFALIMRLRDERTRPATGPEA